MKPSSYRLAIFTFQARNFDKWVSSINFQTRPGVSHGWNDDVNTEILQEYHGSCFVIFTHNNDDIVLCHYSQP